MVVAVVEAAGAERLCRRWSGPPSLSDGEFGAMPVVVVFLVGEAYGESGSGRGGAVDAEWAADLEGRRCGGSSLSREKRNHRERVVAVAGLRVGWEAGRGRRRAPREEVTAPPTSCTRSGAGARV